jgi:hypothetical protein
MARTYQLIIFLILCFTITTLSQQSKEHTLSKNKITSGIYFKWSGEKTQTLRRYDLYFQYNFGKFSENIDTIINDLQTYIVDFSSTQFFLPQNSATLKLSTEWIDILQSQKLDLDNILLDFHELKTNIATISNILEQKRRKKRALLELGQIFSSLIGVASNDQILEISSRISSLESQNREMSTFMEDSISIYNSSYINIVQNRDQIESLQNNNRLIFDHIFNTTNEMSEILNTLAQVTIIYNQNLATFQKSNKMLSAFKRQYDVELDNIAKLANNILPTNLIKPTQLYGILTNISKSLPNSLSLPYKPEKNNILNFYSIIKCNVAKGFHDLHVICSIPLLETQGFYNMYKAYALQLKVQNVTNSAIYTRHKLDITHFLVADDLTRISILSESDYNKCINSPLHFCTWSSATLNTISVENSCVMQIYLTDNMNTDICPIEIIQHPVSYPKIENIANDYWIIQYQHSIKWSIICMGGIEKYIKTKPNFDILRVIVTVGLPGGALGGPRKIFG